MKLFFKSEKHDCLWSIGGRMILLVGIVCVSFLCFSSGPTYARYMTTRNFPIGFGLVSKPSVTVIETTVQANEGEAFTRQFEMQGTVPMTGWVMRLRFYGVGQGDQSLTLSINGRLYLVKACNLNPSTGPAIQLGAEWVYIVADAYGEEILLDMNNEPLKMTITADTDISQLTVCAEVLRK